MRKILKVNFAKNSTEGNKIFFKISFYSDFLKSVFIFCIFCRFLTYFGKNYLKNLRIWKATQNPENEKFEKFDPNFFRFGKRFL